jgi:1,4-alpha-glucan branching enzyme
MWTHPGKKLLFMGGEFGQVGEWNHDGQPEWHLLDDPAHRGVQRLVRDLNRVYAGEPALYERDYDDSGFRWVMSDDHEQSVLAYLRMPAGNGPPVLSISNFTPVPREGYRLGVPEAGEWRPLINTDASCYGGSGYSNGHDTTARSDPWHDQPASLVLDLPPLSTLVLRLDSAKAP